MIINNKQISMHLKFHAMSMPERTSHFPDQNTLNHIVINNAYKYLENQLKPGEEYM